MSFTVSTTHPSIVLTESQLQLPSQNFFRETGSLLKAESSALKGQKNVVDGMQERPPHPVKIRLLC